MKTLNNELTSFLKSNGASLAGYADLNEIDSEARDGFPSGISIAIALNPQVMSGIKTGPTKQYYDEYIRLNGLLDSLAQSAEQFLKGKGCIAKANPATWGMDVRTLATKLPHKTAATRAGLGWVGKCALLVTKEYGSAVRLTSVLTYAPLSVGKSVNSPLCGTCTACVDACPAHAITGKKWEAGLSRESLYNAFACSDKAKELSLEGYGIKITLCGKCIVACPWTQKYLNKA